MSAAQCRYGDGSWLYHRKNFWLYALASSSSPDRLGNRGRYVSVLKWLSGKGLSLDSDKARECYIATTIGEEIGKIDEDLDILRKM